MTEKSRAAPQTGSLLRVRASLATLILFAAFAGCSSGTPPVLFPIEAASVNVNETLVMDINVLNQDGVALSWSFAGPALAALAETTELAGSPTGAVFRWTPLASHVGSHQFDFTASSDAGDSTQSVIITVVPQKGAAPIFIQPGKGGTFDLDVVSCVNFDVEVKDDDTSKVAIRTAGEVPAGLNLKTKGDQRARVDWCPTDSQLNQALSWTLSFEADDGEHEPTQHDYLAVFRRSAQAGCPGSPPSITILEPAPGAIVTSAAGFAVKVQVTDDSEIRDEPILYFTTADPGGAPDITSFTQTAFIQDGSDWVAQVPPVATPDGEPTPVWFAVLPGLRSLRKRCVLEPGQVYAGVRQPGLRLRVGHDDLGRHRAVVRRRCGL